MADEPTIPLSVQVEPPKGTKEPDDPPFTGRANPAAALHRTDGQGRRRVPPGKPS